MSDRVKLPREVVKAIETLRHPDNGFSDFAIIGMMQEKSNHHPPEIDILKSHMGQDKMHPDDLIKALVNGYEVEQTPEDRVKEYYLDLRENGRRLDPHCQEETGILRTLALLGIKIEGVNI